MSLNPKKLVRVVSPWVRGFVPPSKCPGCGHISCLTYTGGNDKNDNHTYRCQVCNSLVGAPTTRAECELMDVPLEKDVFYTSCLACIYRVVNEQNPICIHFRGIKW